LAGQDVDNVVGVHLCGGIDYFILKQVAVGGEFRGVIAPSADITAGGVKTGSYDPISIAVTFSARYFFN
jgi:outer membrane protein